MANPVRSAFGLKPARIPDQHELVVVELTSGTILGIGDTLSISASTPDDATTPKVTRGTASGTVSHVYMGLKDPTHDSVNGYYDGVATDYGLALPVNNNREFLVMEDADGGALSAANIGNVADLTTAADADSVTGRSAFALDSSTAATGGAKHVVILGLSKAANIATGANAIWRVRINELQLVDGFAGI